MVVGLYDLVVVLLKLVLQGVLIDRLEFLEPGLSLHLEQWHQLGLR